MVYQYRFKFCLQDYNKEMANLYSHKQPVMMTENAFSLILCPFNCLSINILTNLFIYSVYDYVQMHAKNCDTL